MRPETVRAYLDGVLTAASFDQLLVPHLDARKIGGKLVFTRQSVDAWIESTGTGNAIQTGEQLARLLDHDDDPPARR
jgi:hypothetical protein